MLKEEFSQYNVSDGSYCDRMTDDRLYDFLISGIGRLEKYGDVHGTEAFKRRTVKPFASVQVGVSVRSGLMDITLTSADYSQRELLEILESYQKKKRYYRLKSGDYVDLTDNAELEDVTAFFGGLDMMPTVNPVITSASPEVNRVDRLRVRARAAASHGASVRRPAR